ncbi:MAG: hypothetical protein ACOVO3_03275 [Fluviicola sp.]|jgi:hypothetical protein
MTWGFYPKIKGYSKIDSAERITVLNLLEQNMKAAGCKINQVTAYTIHAEKRSLFLFSQHQYYAVRIDEDGNLNYEAEMMNTFYDYGLLKKNTRKIFKQLSLYGKD